MAKIYILAAGEQSRWGGSTPKQLASIFGEPVIVRTTRLLKKAGHIPSIVTHRSDISDLCKVPQIFPKERDTILHTLYSTRFGWEDENIVLLGDVYYTVRALNIILQDSSECAFFGNAGEIFALKFKGNYLYRYLTQLCDSQRESLKLWNLYRYLEGIPLDKHIITLRPNGLFKFIDDGTDDIDTMIDVGLIERRLIDTLHEVEYIAHEKIAAS